MGATSLSLTVSACSVPEFEFPPEPTGSAATGGEGDGPPGAVDHCANNQVDADVGESDFDCGRGCSPCSAGLHCLESVDCAEGLLCHDTVCIEPGCMNDALDGSETDVDCGGGGCKPCITGQACAAKTDCDSGVCSDGKCLTPACDDKTLNGKETGVDCGGGCPGCGADEPCVVGADCSSTECNSGACGAECADGFANCDKQNDNACEVNVKTDANNCGRCGQVCQLPHAAAECSAGECRITTNGCAKGYADCNGDPKDGCEVDLGQDKLNCGACNKACPELNGAPFCAAGACQITCAQGFDDCDDKRENGCEKDVSKDVNNCGECGKKCTAASGGTPYCKNGACGETVCPAGLGDCNGNPDDGCEVDLRTDKNNCNTCGNLCVAANGTASCSNRVCQISACDKGFANCSGGYADGCETNTDTSTGNCGGCGKACIIDNGSPKCDAGVCDVNSCTSTFRDCNSDPKDGCEVNIASSAKNCGGCGAAGTDCTTKYAHASSSCSMSACTAPSCNAGYGDCAGGIGDGCETDTTVSPGNCGGCGNVCSTAPGAHVSMNTCAAGQCNPTCAGSFLSCDNNKLNGCEADPTSEANNCGGCGIVCSTAPAAHVTANVCSGSTCSPTCAGTYDDCDSSRTNGCETDTAVSAGNCGACGTVCSTLAGAHVTSNACSGSKCQPKCAANYADCDASRANGCEKDVSSDKTNCGGCNVVCGTSHAAAGTSCGGGTCNPSCDAGWAKCSSPEQGCTTPLGTTSNCTKCGQSCSGGTPFCDPGGCVDHRDIVIVNNALHAVAGWDASNPALSQISLSHSLATPKGNNRMVLVGLGTTQNFSTLSLDKIGVTYDGAPMNQAVQVFDSNNHYSLAVVYYLLDAQLPDSAGAKQVTATFGPGSMWGHGGLHVVELKNTMQVAPIATGGGGDGNNCGANASRTGSVAFSQTGSYVYGFLSARGGNSASLTSGQTSIFTQNQPTPDNLEIAAAQAIVNGNTTMTWTVGNCYHSAIGMVAVKRLSWN